MATSEKPITEQSNDLTSNIDIATCNEIVDLLGSCDKEIFQGWRDYDGLFSTTTLSVLRNIIDKATEILKAPDRGCIVLSGCGTSGRLAFMTSRSFNAKLMELGLVQCYHYLIAGRDKALFTSQEAPEDNPHIGRQMLQEIARGKDRVMVIGITCGLSAPFVAGQLDYCLDHLDTFLPVLLGFNPVHMARDNPVENWDKTFLQVARRMETASRTCEAFILNPVVGPEPITGSSRMKSGSATKLLLEVIFTAAHQEAYFNQMDCNPTLLLQAYDIVRRQTYTYTESIAKIVDIGGTCLKGNGHIYYVGFDELGLVGMIDASECPPTYGAATDDIRAFLDGGFTTFGNKEGHISDFVDISLNFFEGKVIPHLQENDLVIILAKDTFPEVPKGLCGSAAQKVLLRFTMNDTFTTGDTDCFNHVIDVMLPKQDLQNLLSKDVVQRWQQFYLEISCKWICNAVTTGSHIRKGKVFKNYMVDVKVSNNKLYYRAIGIIQKFAECRLEVAEEFLLKSIYETDHLSECHVAAPVSAHLKQATTMDKVVPTGLLMASMHCSILEARNVLQQYPVIRTAVSRYLLSAQ